MRENRTYGLTRGRENGLAHFSLYSTVKIPFETPSFVCQDFLYLFSLHYYLIGLPGSLFKQYFFFERYLIDSNLIIIFDCDQ